MSNAGVHIINKQLFELECTVETHAFEIRHKINYDVQYRMEKIMEHACNHFMEAGEDVRIPVLEIDLGTLSFDRLETELLAAFEKKFAEQLAHHKPVYFDTTEASASKASSLEILRHFLLTGELPWFAGKQDEYYLSALFDEILLASSNQLQKIILLNLHDEQFITRLVEQAGEKHLQSILQLLEIDEDVVIELETIINRILAEIITTTSGGKHETQRDSLPIYREEKRTLYSEAGKRLLQYLRDSPQILAWYINKMAVELLLKIIAKQTTQPVQEYFLVQLDKAIAEHFDIAIKDIPSKQVITEQHIKKLGDKISTIKATADEAKTSLEQEDKEEEPGQSLKFYIPNSGLILLASYLLAFFHELQLLEQGNFKNTQAQVKAVFLLHYLCSGREEVPEYILPLNKILCGLSLDTPLPSFVPLSNIEKEECTELLQEVINNWQRLGNSSIEGLREAFLNRDGIVQFENNGWKLIIDRKGHDVLLDALPWSFAHTKLSWMPHLITTEW